MPRPVPNVTQVIAVLRLLNVDVADMAMSLNVTLALLQTNLISKNAKVKSQKSTLCLHKSKKYRTKMCQNYSKQG